MEGRRERVIEYKRGEMWSRTRTHGEGHGLLKEVPQ